MSELIDSPHYATVVVGNSKIRFADVGRAWDERDHDLFAVQLPARPLLYGEWRPKFAKNGDDFDVEVVFFGLVDPRDAGLPLPARRIAVNRDECLIVEKLFQTLFRAPMPGRRDGPSIAEGQSSWVGSTFSKVGFPRRRLRSP